MSSKVLLAMWDVRLSTVQKNKIKSAIHHHRLEDQPLPASNLWTDDVTAATSNIYKPSSRNTARACSCNATAKRGDVQEGAGFGLTVQHAFITQSDMPQNEYCSVWRRLWPRLYWTHLPQCDMQWTPECVGALKKARSFQKQPNVDSCHFQTFLNQPAKCGHSAFNLSEPLTKCWIQITYMMVCGRLLDQHLVAKT